MQTLQQYAEQIIMVLVGLAAIGIGYTAYAASLWDGDMAANYNKASSYLADANTVYLDQILQDADRSDEERAQIEKDYNQQFDLYEAATADAEKANTTGDKFMLYGTLYSVVLFFGSIASILRSPRARLINLVVSSGVLIYATTMVMMLRLPS